MSVSLLEKVIAEKLAGGPPPQGPRRGIVLPVLPLGCDARVIMLKGNLWFSWASQADALSTAHACKGYGKG